MLTCFYVNKKHIIFQILYIIASPLCPASLKALFSTKPLLPTSAVCSDWPTDPVHYDWLNTSTCWKCKVGFIRSSWTGEQSRVTNTGMLVCICSTQATVKMISDSAVIWPCSPLTHTYTTRHAQNSAFEQSIANTWTNNKTYSGWFRSARLSQLSQNLPPFFRNSLHA